MIRAAGCALFSAVAIISGSLYAARELTLGEYTAEVKSRVVDSIRGALNPEGRVTEVAGTVTYAGDECFFLQRDGDAIKVLYTGAELPLAGEVVMVEGAPSLEGGRIVFEASKWRKTAISPLPPAKAVSSADLVNADSGVNWIRVRMVGRAIDITEHGFAISVDGLPINVVTRERPGFLQDCEQTHPQVRVCGVVELLLDQSALLRRGSYVMGVRLNVDLASDIELLPDAAYLLARRDGLVRKSAMALFGVFALALLVLAVVIFRQRHRLFRSRTIMSERKRMADDLHDTIEQHLVGAGMLLKLNRLKEAQDVLVRAKREIRDIVWGLKNDDMMRLSPAAMLRQLAHDENLRGLFRVDTRIDGLPEQLDAAAMRDLSLIVREAIGNAVKHGGAKKIAISADPLPDGGWWLRIANDGAQFDPQTVPGAAEGHFGLEGMRQRARRLGAEIDFAVRGAGMVMNLRKKGVQ